MTRIYIVRHAEAEGNLYRVCEGHYDGLLTPRGRTQLPCLAEYFRGIRLDAVYSSDLYRAYETAQAVASSSGLPVIPRSDLRELGFGEFEGLSWGNIFYSYPEAGQRFQQEYRSFAAPGGETTRQAADRLIAAVREIASRHPGGTVALCGHCAALGAFFPAITGDFDSMQKMRYVRNAAVSLVETDGEHHRVIFFDDVSHVEAGGTMSESTARRTRIQLRFRQADPDTDEGFLRECGAGAWSAVYGNLRMFSPERYFENTSGILGADSRNALIAYDEDKPAGLLLLDSRQKDEPATGHIALVYLLPEYRGMGLGAQLIGRAVIDYRARGMRTLRLNVASVNKTAQRFYERIGFTRTAPLRSVVTRQHVMKMDIGVAHVPAQKQEY